MKWLRLTLGQNLPFVLAVAMFAVLYAIYVGMHPSYSPDVIVQNANETFALIMVSMAQTVPVLLGGIDLSVGPLMTMVNCFASELVSGSATDIILGIVACLAIGAAGGFLNGCIVVYGRIQAIIATLATGAMFLGAALFLRPTPGGTVDEDLGWAMTNGLNDFGDTYHLWGNLGWVGRIPVPVVLLLLILLLVWLPFRRSTTGRGCYAIGSAEGAAYMSGVRVDRSRLAAFTLGGFFAGCGGLYLALQTTTGSADVAQAGEYTLRSIAAVVIGGTSLFGGTGGAVGTIFGALVLRAISWVFRVVPEGAMMFGVVPIGFVASPLLQPLFEGLILLLAVSLGAARVFQVRNRLALFT
jgi:ribose transport system permease protein